MEKTYRLYQPEQLLLLPPALQDWLPSDHEDELRGYPAYHPAMMEKLLLYPYHGRDPVLPEDGYRQGLES